MRKEHGSVHVLLTGVRRSERLPAGALLSRLSHAQTCVGSRSEPRLPLDSIRCVVKRPGNARVSDRGNCEVCNLKINAPGYKNVYKQSKICACRSFSLLKEAQPLDKRSAELGGSDQWHAHSDDADSEQLAQGRLLSRYGIWLLVELCPPNDNADVETLGRLISMLFQVLCSTML